MVNLLLGSTGSGKSRYMYSLALEKCKEGHKCIIISNEGHPTEFKEKIKTGYFIKMINMDTLFKNNIAEAIYNEIGNETEFVFLDLMGLDNNQIDDILNYDFGDVKVYFTFQLSNRIDNYKEVVTSINDNLPTEKIDVISLVERLEDSIIVWNSEFKDEESKFLGFKTGKEFPLDNLKELNFTEIKPEDE